MPEYAVHSIVYFTHKVKADTPEDAAQAVMDGEAGTGEATGGDIDRVTAVADHDWQYANLPELRAPVTCTRCGTVQPAGSEDLCTKCWLATQGVDRA